MAVVLVEEGRIGKRFYKVFKHTAAGADTATLNHGFATVSTVHHTVIHAAATADTVEDVLVRQNGVNIESVIGAAGQPLIDSVFIKISGF